MSDEPFDAMKREIDRAREEHRRALEEALNEIHRAISRAQVEMRVARKDFRRTLERARRQLDRLGRWPDPKPPRRPRRDPGGELEPVNPRPKPNLLSGGAEAPID